MNKPISLFCFVFLFLLSSQAQTMQKTPLAIPQMKSWMPMKINSNSSTMQLIDTDSNTYYFHLVEKGLRNINAPDSHSILLVNKYLTTIRKVFLWEDTNNSFLEIISNDKKIIVLAKEFKHGKSISIIRKIYSKPDLTLLDETKIATFEIGSPNPSNFHIVKSPDKSKTGFVGLVAKDGILDSYNVTIIDNSGEIIWKTIEKLKFGDKPFIIEDIALTNNAQMFIAFHSRPKDEKATNDRKSDLNILFLDANDKSSLHIPFENKMEDVKLHVLKNGNLFIAGILSLSTEGCPFQYFNKIISEHNLEIIGKDSQEISFTKNDFLYEVNPSSKIFDFTVNVLVISELNNGNISILCEQISDVVIKSDVLYRYLKTRGNIVSFLSENDGIIKSKNEIEKFQQQTANFDANPHLMHVSVLSFTYENKTAYLFNDAIRNYETLSPPKEKVYFDKKYGRDSGIYMIVEEDGDLSKTIALTGIDPAKKFLCEVLVVEKDKAIVLTRNKKSAYIEIVPLP